MPSDGDPIDQRLRQPAIWRLLAALVFSILVHWLVLGGLDLRLPPLDKPDQTLIQVQLAPPAAEPARPALPPPRKVAKHVSKPKPPAPKPSPPELSKPEPKVVEPEAVVPAPPPEPATPVAPAVASEPEMASPEEGHGAPEVTADTTEPPEAEAPEPVGLVTGVSAYIEADFNLRQKSGVVGSSHVSFKQYPDGTYTLVSTTEANGLLSLFLRGQLIQKSEGVVTAKGLQPARFSYVMTSNDDKTRRASFDWQSGKLALETHKGVSQVALVPGAQDLLSFMYQFVFVPPLESMEIPITNGKKLDTYSYSFEGEEELRTDMGNIRTLHLVHDGSNEEKTELWLALGYQYMPVKIRKTEDNGSVIEEVITKLSTDILK
ncbi:MAG TPA: DUF3108 domain-containing protein [Methylophilaceae bacterium]|nr:DUF3108 domain-containing protein [Methylophilaceae bacterium]